MAPASSAKISSFVLARRANRSRIDADTTIDAAVLHATLRAIRAGAVSGCAPCRFEGRIPLHARWLAAVSIAIIRLARMGNGCFLFCTRDAFIAAGGFDETLYGAEDIALSRALKRIGSFAVLRERVITSGRKVRAHTGREALHLVATLALQPRRSLRSRDGPLAIWYDGRRDDPDCKA